MARQTSRGNVIPQGDWRAGRRGTERKSGMTARKMLATAIVHDDEHKRAALGYLTEAWAEARLDGIDGDCLAQASLFTAIAEYVGTYGEEAVAKFAEGLAVRIRNGEFSLDVAIQ
jgi:hypothetical protein